MAGPDYLNSLISFLVQPTSQILLFADVMIGAHLPIDAATLAHLNEVDDQRFVFNRIDDTVGTLSDAISALS